jgi:putative acetyltransferase
MELRFIKTIGTNADFQFLVKQLDDYTRIIDKEEFGFYAQFNTSLQLENVLLAYHNNIVVGCGAIKAYNQSTYEIKRMFVTEHCRGKGIAVKLLQELELWAIALNATHCILETGIEFTTAQALYTKMGYQNIPNYGQYIGVVRSICFEKKLC